jgi:hypothetical protein
VNHIESSVNCQRFAGDPVLEPYCAYLAIQDNPDPEEAIEGCERAGSWEAACRGEWVSVWGRSGKPADTTTLLKVCGANHDCAFDVIEARPSGDVTVDLKRCEEHAGAYSRDCAAHMLNRWLETGPDVTDITHLTSYESQHAKEQGDAVAYLSACLGVGSCQGSADMVRHCEQTAADFRRRPDRCPHPTGGQQLR